MAQRTEKVHAVAILLGLISGSLGSEYEDVFRDIAPCNVIEVYRRCRGACSFLHWGLVIYLILCQSTPRNFPEDSHRHW
jgi:hypothetical protein